MNYCSCGHEERKEEVKGKESNEGRVIYGEAPSNSADKVCSDVGDRRKEVSNYSCTPE